MIKQAVAVIASLSALAPSMAIAAPAYLTCQLPGVELQVTADEANGTVTIYNAENGRTDTVRGIYRPTELIFGTSLVGYRINRQTLRIERRVPRLKVDDSGQCALQKVAPRAF